LNLTFLFFLKYLSEITLFTRINQLKNYLPKIKA